MEAVYTRKVVQILNIVAFYTTLLLVLKVNRSTRICKSCYFFYSLFATAVVA